MVFYEWTPHCCTSWVCGDPWCSMNELIIAVHSGSVVTHGVLWLNTPLLYIVGLWWPMVFLECMNQCCTSWVWSSWWCCVNEQNPVSINYLIHMSIIMSLFVCLLEGWAASGLAWQKCWTFCTNFLTKFCHTAIGTIHFYHSIPLSVPLTLFGGHKSAKSKTSWLHFLAHFSTDQDEIWYGVEAVQAENPDTISVWDIMEEGK